MQGGGQGSGIREALGRLLGDRLQTDLLQLRVEAGSERLEELAVGEPSPADVAAFEDQVARDIAPINTTGLCDRARRNLYPYS